MSSRPVNQAVGGHQVAVAQPVGLPLYARNRAPGLTDDEPACGHVPGVELYLPKAIQTPGGHVGQVEGGGPGAPHHEPLGQGPLKVDQVFGVFANVIGETSGQQAP